MNRFIIGRLEMFLLCTALSAMGCAPESSTDGVSDEYGLSSDGADDGDRARGDAEGATGSSNAPHAVVSKLSYKGAEGADNGPLPEPWTSGPLPEPWNSTSSSSSSNGSSTTSSSTTGSTGSTGSTGGTDKSKPH